MTQPTRRSLLRNSVGLVAATALARHYIADAAAVTGTVWVAQGVIPSEDVALGAMVADYEKQSGNKIDLSIISVRSAAPERDRGGDQWRCSRRDGRC